jgi:hypothetical protein
MENKEYKVLVRMRDQSEHEVCIMAPNETVAGAYAAEHRRHAGEEKWGAITDRQAFLDSVYDEIVDNDVFEDDSDETLQEFIRSCKVIDTTCTYCPWDDMDPDAEVLEVKEIK